MKLSRRTVPAILVQVSFSSLFKIISRLVMACALILGIWFFFIQDRSGHDKKTGKEEEVENKQGISSEGEMPQPYEEIGGGTIKEVTSDNRTTGSQAPPKREWRKIQAIHLHLPEDSGSREIARSLEEIRTSYPEHVFISTIDVSSTPQKLKDWRVSRAPAIVFQTEGERLASLEEVWPKPRLTKKIEELVYGLIRVGKDWRPEVKGLEPR